MPANFNVHFRNASRNPGHADGQPGDERARERQVGGDEHDHAETGHERVVNRPLKRSIELAFDFYRDLYPFQFGALRVKQRAERGRYP